MTHVDLRIPAQKSDGKWVRSCRLMSVVKTTSVSTTPSPYHIGENLPFALHDVIVAQPFKLAVSLVDTRGVQADRLVVPNITIAPAILYKQFRIEAPGNHTRADDIVV